jgi:hypothetical protein
MTAPGQEPDEVLTAKPGGKEDPAEPNLNAVGDSHMPEDVREAVREEAEKDRAAKSENDELSEPGDSDGEET